MYGSSPKSVRPGPSQDWVRVHFPLVDGNYPAEWMAESWFRFLILILTLTWQDIIGKRAIALHMESASLQATTGDCL